MVRGETSEREKEKVSRSWWVWWVGRQGVREKGRKKREKEGEGGRETGKTAP